MKDPLDIRFEKTAKGGRYVMVMPNGEYSRLTFIQAGEGHIIADHTFVPPPYRNQGVAEAMVERLIADARVRGVKITRPAGSSPTSSPGTGRSGTTCWRGRARNHPGE
jgi:uncharacterized protein